MRISVLDQQASGAITSTVALEPVRQILLSMALLTTETINETEEWLSALAPRLPAATAHTNRLSFSELAAAVFWHLDAPNFPAYLAALATEPPDQVAARVKAGMQPQLDTVLQQETARLFADPAAMQQRIVSHLAALWTEYFAATWEKKSSMMTYIARELNGRSWPTTSASALIRALIRRPVPEWLAQQLGGVERIILVPSPYLQFQAARFAAPTDAEATTLWLFLWADFWVWPMRTEPIQRSEVLSPINALADETRLRILELLAATTELRAQEIIAHLDVSQSTVSRHLKQLQAAGFISETRAGDTNKSYRLHAERLGEVAYSLSALLSAENASLVLNDARLAHPAELRPFLDREGLVTSWPAKRKGQEAVLAYLTTKFTVGQVYAESGVNELLRQWHTYNDPAYLRRCLIEGGLLKRTADGAQYWRA